MKTKQPTRADLSSAVQCLSQTERGRKALRDVLGLINNGASGLDFVGQNAVGVILACQFGPFAGSTREVIREALSGVPVLQLDSSIPLSQDIATFYRWREVGETQADGDVVIGPGGVWAHVEQAHWGEEVAKPYSVKTNR